MGIISPKNRNAASPVLITLLLIVLSPILVIPVFLYLLWGVVLYMAIWLSAKNPFVIFVYSDSPIWKDYIEKEILSHLQDRAEILNWSRRSQWKNSLAVLAFRYFGGYRNFNPIGIVFRPFQLVKTYRFFKAFKEFKHGKLEKVDNIKKELFDEIGI